MGESIKLKSAKEDVIEMIRRLPDDCTLQEIQYHLGVRAKVEQAIEDVDAGRVHTQEEVERMSAEWLKSSGLPQP